MWPRLDTRGPSDLDFGGALISQAASPVLARRLLFFPAVRGRACVEAGALPIRGCFISPALWVTTALPLIACCVHWKSPSNPARPQGAPPSPPNLERLTSQNF